MITAGFPFSGVLSFYLRRGGDNITQYLIYENFGMKIENVHLMNHQAIYRHVKLVSRETLILYDKIVRSSKKMSRYLL